MSEQTSYSPIAFLGLVADYKRKLKDGRQYDKYFPKSLGTYDIVTNNGNVHRTVQEMDKYCRETLVDTAKIAPLLKGKTLQETLKNVFQFWYDHCQYKLDKDGVEEIRRPRRAWQDGQILSRNPLTEPQAGIDCDCFSLSVGSCLMNLGIDFKFRITKYNAGWQHVYVIVPVPNDSKRYWVIDCVLNRFNEEKTYTDKFDHTMNSPKTFLGGIPLARLGAIGDAAINVAHDKNQILCGAHFGEIEVDELDGTEDNSPILKSILAHIVATRDIIRKDPSSIPAGGAEAYLAMLDKAIAKWNTPERDAVLDLLEKEEERWNQITEKNGTVSGTDGVEEEEFSFTAEDDEAIEGLSLLGKLSLKKAGKTFFSNVKKAVTAVKKVNTAIVKKVVGQKGLDKINKVKEKVKAVAKKVGAAIKKFIVLSNPLTLAMRAGFLLAMKTNLFQWAERAYPAYFSQAEAAKMGITKSAWELSKKGKDALEKTFVGIGGKPSKLEHYIKTGRAQKKLSGLGVIATSAVIVSSAATLIAAGAKMATAGMTNKAYAAAQKEHDAAVTRQTQIKYGKKGGKNGATDGLGEDAPIDSEAEVEAPEVTEADAKDTKGGKFKKFIDAIKNFFSKKANQAAGSEDSTAVTSELQTDAANPGEAASSVEADANAASKAAYDAAIAAGKTTAEAIEAGKQAYEDAGGGSTGSGGGIWDFVKSNPVPVAIGVVVAGAALTFALSSKARAAVGFGKKPKAQLSGVGKVALFKSGHKINHPKAMLPKGSKIKRVTLK